MYHVDSTLQSIYCCVLPFNLYLFLELFNLKIAIISETLNSREYKFYTNNIQHGKKLCNISQRKESQDIPFITSSVDITMNCHLKESMVQEERLRYLPKRKLSSWNNCFTIIQKLPSDMHLKSLNTLLVWFTKH